MNEYGECIEEPEAIKLPAYALLLDLPAAEVMPVVAVYGFKDLQDKEKDKTVSQHLVQQSVKE